MQIKKDFLIEQPLHLFVNGYAVPPSSCTDVLRDNDVVRVAVLSTSLKVVQVSIFI
jgi:hypothetical protein